ncbi:T9SS type A sorting domain-containing protein [Billgrantia antri]|uniref:Uncharacterized protein n=1 Tax=Billgrantia antri TaxID=2846777 RepID=A0ABS6ZIQ3_9GAMM|nr:T9SS type A sorting domain-containing protein [Halomonas antri]MBW6389820.1 hypothetical protein [Halomonas antri]
MKTTMKLAGTVLAAALAFGGIGQAAAMTLGLNNGTTGAKAVGGTDRYTLHIDNPTQLRVHSKSSFPLDGPHIRVRANLLDESGNVVTQGARNGNNFVLNSQVQPGTYILEVNSTNLSGHRRGWNSYELHSSF